MTPQQILSAAHTILVIDWPSRDVPDTLVRAGFQVIVRGGPKPEDLKRFEMRDGAVAAQALDAPLAGADLLYVYRPLAELPAIVREAQQLGAKAIWYQSGRTADGARDPKACWLPEGEAEFVRSIVEGAGLALVTSQYIADAAQGP